MFGLSASFSQPFGASKNSKSFSSIGLSKIETFLTGFGENPSLLCPGRTAFVYSPTSGFTATILPSASSICTLPSGKSASVRPVRLKIPLARLIRFLIPPPWKANRPKRSRRCSCARSERFIGEFPSPNAARSACSGTSPCGSEDKRAL